MVPCLAEEHRCYVPGGAHVSGPINSAHAKVRSLLQNIEKALRLLKNIEKVLHLLENIDYSLKIKAMRPLKNIEKVLRLLKNT